MKISREFWFLSAIILIPFAGFWLLIQTPGSQLRQFQEHTSWFPITISLLSIICLAGVISRNWIAIWSTIRKNPTPLLIWMYFWLAAFAFLFFQHMQQSSLRFSPSPSMSFLMMTATGAPAFALTQKLQGSTRIVWLIIAALAYIAACISLQIGWIS